MRALQLMEPWKFEEVSAPEPELAQEGWIKVRLRCGLICGTDLPYFDGLKPWPVYPLEPGRPVHECAGEVVESTSPAYAAGDRVVAMPDADMGLAEYYVCPAQEAVKIPDGVADWAEAVLAQPLSTVLLGVDRLGDVAGRSATVVGAGAIGLMTVRLLAEAGAGPICVVDPVVERCEMALKLGATEARAMDSARAAALLRSGRFGLPEADIAVEAVGHNTTTINDCLLLARKYGTVLAMGVPDHEVYAFAYNTFFRRNLALIGSVTPDWEPYQHRAMDMLAANLDAYGPLVTHRFPVREAQAAYTLAHSRGQGCVKVALEADWD